jgi:hypothetical protein
MTKDEALNLALDALETSMYPQQKQLQAITAIKEALAQPEQEPVAWVDLELWTNDETWPDDCFSHLHVEGWTPLYITPPQRKPLSEEEIGAILEDVNAYGTRLYTFARAIEAAHGIKE